MVKVNPLPTALANITTAATAICIVCRYTTLFRSGTSYVWKNAADALVSSKDSLMVSPTSTKTYRVKVTNANECDTWHFGTVTVDPFPTPNANSTKAATAKCIGGSATYVATGGTSY